MAHSPLLASTSSSAPSLLLLHTGWRGSAAAASSPLRLGAWRAVAVVLTGHETSAPSVEGAILLLHVAVRLLSYENLRCEMALLVLTRSVQAAPSSHASRALADCAHGGAWGLMRVFRHEHATPFRVITADVGLGFHPSSLVALTSTVAGESELACFGYHPQVARLRRALPIACTAGSRASSGSFGQSYVISGGLGGLGLAAARLLVQQGAAHVLLAARGAQYGARSAQVARTGQGLEAQLSSLQSQGGTVVHICAADVSDVADVCATLRRCSQPSSFIHAASAFGSALLGSAAAPAVLRDHLWGPKPRGAHLLDQASRQLCLEARLLLSSLAALAIAAVYRGTGAYSAANSYLDAVGAIGRSAGLAISSLQMANVAQQGIGALASDMMASRAGMVRISLEEYLASVAMVLRAPSSSAQCSVGCILPSSPPHATAQFEGWSTSMISEVHHVLVATQSNAQLTRHLSTTERVHAAHAAVCALDAAVAAARPVAQFPTSCEAVIIGAGITGLSMAAALRRAGVQAAILEARPSVGGVWRAFGNPHSRVNSTEPAYRMQVHSGHLHALRRPFGGLSDSVSDDPLMTL